MDANPVSQTATVTYDPAGTNLADLRHWIEDCAVAHQVVRRRQPFGGPVVTAVIPSSPGGPCPSWIAGAGSSIGWQSWPGTDWPAQW